METIIIEMVTMGSTVPFLDSSWVPTIAPNISNTTDFIELLEEMEEEEEKQYNSQAISTRVFLIAAPIIIFTGVLGNGLSILILQSKHFRSAPSSFILSILALVDTGSLLTGLLRHWIRGLTGGKVDVRSFSHAGCQAHYMMTYMLPQLSSWTLVLMTLERLISVVNPMRSRELASRKKILLGWLVIFVCLFVVNSQTFATVKLYVVPYTQGNVTTIFQYCYYKVETIKFNLYKWPWIDTMLLSIVPVCLVFLSNIVIITQVVRATRRRTKEMQVKGAGGGTQSITIMLVSISIVFLFTTAPVGIYFLGMDVWPGSNNWEMHQTWMAYTATNLLYYFNNCLNFFMYCLSGSRFRRALVAMFCCREMSTKKGTTGGPGTRTTQTGSTASSEGNVTLSTMSVASKSAPATNGVSTKPPPDNCHM